MFIVDGSEADESRQVVQRVSTDTDLPTLYIRSGDIGSARQRNLGLDGQKSEFIVFLDDDVTFDEDFIGSLIAPMASDPNHSIGGTAALITNELAGSFSNFNRVILKLILGKDPTSAQGRVIGPAFQAPLLSAPPEPIPVEYLSTCGCAYRASTLGELRFDRRFSGYSFMEDVDLSYRISRIARLLAVTAAQMVHMGMGSLFQHDWFRDGEQRIMNRHFVLRKTMGDRRLSSFLRLLVFELLYTPVTSLRACLRSGHWGRTWSQTFGRFSGALRIAGFRRQ